MTAPNQPSNQQRNLEEKIAQLQDQIKNLREQKAGLSRNIEDYLNTMSMPQIIWWLLTLMIIAWVILSFVYTGLIVGWFAPPQSITVNQINVVKGVADDLWNLLTPIIQLTLILVVVFWAIGKARLITATDENFMAILMKSDSIRPLIAVMVVITFALAVLTGHASTDSALKDVVLVVIAFYFGSAENKGKKEVEKQGSVEQK